MSIKVLVADDSITIQKVIGIIFSGDEYLLTIVDNGRAAVDSARESEPDILLIDALMPGMSGYEVVEAIRATPNLANKPVLFLTGSFEPFDEEKAKKCGADDFISKPFESQQIIAKVKALLELGGSRSQSAPGQAELSPVTHDEPAVAVAVAVAPPAMSLTPETTQSEAPADIWGAFTAVEEPFVENIVEPIVEPVVETEAFSFEPDVFAIVSEENDAQLVAQSNRADVVPAQQSVTQWLPVEENTFEFAETDEESLPQTSTEPGYAAQEESFGDVSFEDEAPTAPFITQSGSVETESTPPEFDNYAESDQTFVESVVVEEPELSTAQAANIHETDVAIPVNLSEEQLKAAITAASRDVIERIVWEVVPDLAEAMIREAIRKIREGA